MVHPTKLRSAEAPGESEARAERAVGDRGGCNAHASEGAEHCSSVGPQHRKRLARARIETAEILDEELDKRWRDGADEFSNRAIAERLLDVDEKTVRQWRDGDKPMPIAALLCMPLDFGEDLAERLLSARRLLAGDRRAIVALGRAVERCNQYAIHGVMTSRDREGAASAIRAFAEQLEEIAASLEEP